MTTQDETRPDPVVAAYLDPDFDDEAVGGDSKWRDRGLTVLSSLLVLAGVIGVWAILTYGGFVHPIVLPSPGATWDGMKEVVTADNFMENLRVTLTETLLGGAIGGAVGLVTGAIVAISKLGRIVLLPIMVTLSAVPALVLAPLFLIWFGYGMSSKVALIILATFFPIFVTTVQGIMATPEAHLKLMRSLGASWMWTFWAVRIPGALPSIFAGIRASIASAFSAAVVSEFVGATAGLGLQVLIYNETLQIPEVYALVILMVVVGLMLYALADLVDRRVVFWRGR